MCRWSQEPEEVEFELTVLERLAERYGQRKGLWGIEIINEPALEGIWKSMDVPNRYPAVDQERRPGPGRTPQSSCAGITGRLMTGCADFCRRINILCSTTDLS